MSKPPTRKPHQLPSKFWVNCLSPGLPNHAFPVRDRAAEPMFVPGNRRFTTGSFRWIAFTVLSWNYCHCEFGDKSRFTAAMEQSSPKSEYIVSLRQIQPLQFPELPKEMRVIKLLVRSLLPFACPEIQRTDDTVNLDQYRLYFMHFVEVKGIRPIP